MMSHFLRGVFFILMTFVFSLGQSWAHVEGVSPVPRYYDDGVKGANTVCGDGRGYPASNQRTNLDAGSQLTIRIEETIEHRGYFGVYFSRANDAKNPAGCGQKDGKNLEGSCMEMTLRDDLVDGPSDQGFHEFTVNLPDLNCEDCTIQVIQWMDMGTRFTPYYICLDVALSGSQNDGGSDGGDDPTNDDDQGSNGGSSGSENPSGDDAGNTDSTDGEANEVVSRSKAEGGGCTLDGSVGTNLNALAAYLGLLLFLRLLATRRSRKRQSRA